MKKISILKLEWKHLHPAKKSIIVGALFAFVIGTILIVIGFSVMFGYIKPYKNWKYYECINRNEDFFKLDSDHVKIIYNVDGEVYEKECRLRTRDLHIVYFWYNAENPDEIIFGKSCLMVILPIFICIGIALYFIDVIAFIRLKKLKKIEI